MNSVVKIGLGWLAIPLVAALLMSSRGYAQSSLPVVPGAAGYGMNTRAAYACGSSPAVHRVTNLNDSGAGSLRAALTAAGPRVVIFEISGYINLSSDVVITSPCLTVAGQTAPSPGITVRMVPGGGASEAMIMINTHDVLFQHFRVRPGWGDGGGDSICNSGVRLYGGSEYNVVMDHMSISWAQDENFHFGYGTSQNGGLTNATMWRSIVAEGLTGAPGSGSCTGGGVSGGHGIAAAGAKRIAVVQTLIANNRERNPWFLNTHAAVVNNLVYNWANQWGLVISDATNFGGGVTGTIQVSAVGNRFIVGANGTLDGFNYVVMTGGIAPFVPGHQVYLSDNTLDQASYSGVSVTPYQNALSYDPRVGSPPPGAPFPSGLNVMASSNVEQFVLENAGARPLDRDAVDQRIVRDVRSRTGIRLSSPNEVGGYPSLPANHRALTLPSNPNAVTPSGYTNLEKWLHGYAAALETGAEINAPDGPPPPTGVRIVS
jgi:hypothetical protein